MEDARFVRFTDGAEPAYCATYTAFDGGAVASHLLETADFRTFTVSPLAGPATRNKGMALFPRRIAGRYAALSRWDGESNAIAYSTDGRRWGPGVTIQSPARPWELIQLGNCGSPIETPAGWLAFTHGVGPIREYAIGAILLDLDEPEHLISALPEPLLVADESERRIRPERRLLLRLAAARRDRRTALRVQRFLGADRDRRALAAASRAD
jgi:predicted GH43/DUF377 family glycosyl hydrolase